MLCKLLQPSVRYQNGILFLIVFRDFESLVVSILDDFSEIMTLKGTQNPKEEVTLGKSSTHLILRGKVLGYFSVSQSIFIEVLHRYFWVKWHIKMDNLIGTKSPLLIFKNVSHESYCGSIDGWQENADYSRRFIG
jgi:hypothetical protein